MRQGQLFKIRDIRRKVSNEEELERSPPEGGHDTERGSRVSKNSRKIL